MREFSFYVWMPMVVTVDQPAGVPGESFGVTIGGCYYGKIVKVNGKWISQLSPKAGKELSRDDIQAIGEWIDEQYPD